MYPLFEKIAYTSIADTDELRVKRSVRLSTVSLPIYCKGYKNGTSESSLYK